MSKYYNILFDLDGTIINSSSSIINSSIYSIKKINKIKNLNIEIPSDNILKKFIGPPLDISFRKYCYDDYKLSILFVKYYREDYNDGLLNCNLYDGIFDLIKTLYNYNYKIFLVTAKPKEYAIKIIEHFNMIHFFNNFYAPIIGGKIKNKLD